MKVTTTRFGEIDVRDEDVFDFPEGMLGFGAIKKYCTLKNPGGGPFEWLQAIEEPSLAFVICDPLLFKPDYGISVKQEELAGIKVENIADASVRVVLVVPRGNPERMTANLKGPIVFNTRENLASQLILSGDTYDTRHRIFQQTPQAAASGQAE